MENLRVGPEAAWAYQAGPGSRLWAYELIVLGFGFKVEGFGSKLSEGDNIGEYVGEYYRGYSGGY